MTLEEIFNSSLTFEEFEKKLSQNNLAIKDNKSWQEIKEELLSKKEQVSKN